MCMVWAGHLRQPMERMYVSLLQPWQFHVHWRVCWINGIAFNAQHNVNGPQREQPTNFDRLCYQIASLAHHRAMMVNILRYVPCWASPISVIIGGTGLTRITKPDRMGEACPCWRGHVPSINLYNISECHGGCLSRAAVTHRLVSSHIESKNAVWPDFFFPVFAGLLQSWSGRKIVGRNVLGLSCFECKPKA